MDACQLHNLHCAYPDCEKPTDHQISDAIICGIVINHRFVKDGRDGSWWDGASTAEEIRTATERGKTIEYGFRHPDQWDAYHGAMEGLQEWKKRALEAEKKLAEVSELFRQIQRVSETLK